MSPGVSPEAGESISPGQLVAFLWPRYAPLRGRLAGVGVVALLGISASLTAPLLWRFLIDGVLVARRPDLLASVFLAYGLLEVLETLADRVGAGLMNRVTVAVRAALTGDIHRKLLRQSLGYLHDQRSGDLIERARSDVGQVVDGVQDALLRLLRELVKVVAALAMIAWLDARLAAGLAALVLLVVPPTGFAYERMAGGYRTMRAASGEVASALTEDLQGVSVLKAFGAEGARQRVLDDLLERLSGIEVRTLDRAHMHYAVVTVAGRVAGLGLVGAGSLLVLRGELTVGTLLACQVYWWAIWWPVVGIAETLHQLQRARVAAERVQEVLEAPEAVVFPATDGPRGPVSGEIRFQGVTFGYHPERPVLRDLELRVAPGERLALVGPSGAGKSSLLRLVLRFWDPSEGVVWLGGRDLRSLSRAELAATVGYVEQEPFLFSGSVAENLRVGRPEARDAELEEAARRAFAHEFVAALPEGYRTTVGERGVKLSGGQRQRLCIARAFLANPPVMLLDEATSSVEPEAEGHILLALAALMEGRTTLLVTHKLHLARDADRVAVVRGGGLQELGTPAALRAAGGWYARTEALQARLRASEDEDEDEDAVAPR